MPPLKRTQDGVQIRLTIGQMPRAWARSPATMPMAAAMRRRLTGILGAEALSQRPAARPRIMVARVGMKLRVRYPPELASKGFTRGKRLRNQTSKAQPRLAFLAK